MFKSFMNSKAAQIQASIFTHAVLALVFAIILIGSVKAQDRPNDLIKQWESLDQKCRGGSGDSPATEVACDRREKVAGQIKPTGWCYGDDSLPTAYWKWHICKKGSWNADGSAAKNIKPVSLSDKPFTEMLKGTWRSSEYKTCKAAKDVDQTMFFNGLKLTYLESDCIVMGSKSGNNSLTLKLMCVSEGERMQSNATVKFIDDNTVRLDTEEYKKCL